jgi:hypothetical protein
MLQTAGGREGVPVLPGLHRFRARRRTRGQSLVEFALILPLLLILLAFGLDLGRVFLGWVNLNNSARVAATYAASNPNAWISGIPNAMTVEYQRLVTADADVINCDMPSPIPDPTFPSGHLIGDPARVAFTCRFHLITPILSFVLGNGLDVSASSAFPIRSGVINGIPVQTAIPLPTPTPSPSPSPSPSPTPTPGPTGTPGPTASPSPSPSPTPTPNPFCTVPSFGRTNQAQKEWSDAGFMTSVVFNPLVPPHYNIGNQSFAAGTQQLCATAVITVSP